MQDATLFLHAGMIAHGLGRTERAKGLLRRFLFSALSGRWRWLQAGEPGIASAMPKHGERGKATNAATPPGASRGGTASWFGHFPFHRAPGQRKLLGRFYIGGSVIMMLAATVPRSPPGRAR